MNRAELADAMRDGLRLPGAIEDKDVYVDARVGGCRVCALGAALVFGYDGDYQKAEAEFEKLHDRAEFGTWGHQTLAAMLGVPEDLAAEVSERDHDGESIEQIAAWLKA